MITRRLQELSKLTIHLERRQMFSAEVFTSIHSFRLLRARDLRWRPYGLDFISWLGDWRAAAGEIQVERDAGRKSVAG